MIGVCYLGELFYAKPPLGTVAKHAFVPQFAGSESVLLAVGILGATVMPHVIYLHSALLQDRVLPKSEEQARRLFRFTRIDVVIAMTLAGLINIAMLVVAASTSFRERPHERRFARDRAQDAVRAARRLLEHALCPGTARLGPLELDGRHARRTGGDAGVHPPPDPASGCAGW